MIEDAGHWLHVDALDTLLDLVAAGLPFIGYGIMYPAGGNGIIPPSEDGRLPGAGELGLAETLEGVLCATPEQRTAIQTIDEEVAAEAAILRDAAIASIGAHDAYIGEQVLATSITVGAGADDLTVHDAKVGGEVLRFSITVS